MVLQDVEHRRAVRRNAVDVLGQPSIRALGLVQLEFLPSR
jgi:hypothetical protein